MVGPWWTTVTLAQWRIPLALLATLVLLASGAALTGQVERELENEIDGVELFDDATLKPPESLLRNLDPSDLTIPEDLDITIPEGTDINFDGSELTLDEPLDIDLPPDFPLEDLDIPLPQDFNFDLPEGTEFDAEGLTFPNGGRITLPDGSVMDLPPGSRLDLPKDVIDQLRDQGVEYGTLPRDMTVPITGLPEGLSGSLDLPALPEGGTLTLPAGTKIKLPPGAEAPFGPGEVPFDAKWTLPRGTTFDWPALLGAAAAGAYGAQYGSFPGVTPSGDERPVPGGEGPPPCDGCITPDTVITSEYPTRLRKGQPFEVSGYVHSGPPTRGVAIQVFVNETKEAPGHFIGSTVTDDNGNWNARVSLPTDLPAGDYQLVARSSPYTGSDGAPRREGWSDPPIGFVAATSLTIEVPSFDGLGARVPVKGHLHDETDAPVANAPVNVFADGILVARVRTDDDGAWSAGVTLNQAGDHEIRARFNGNEFLDASQARATVTIQQAAIDIVAFTEVRRGDATTLTGRVLADGAGASGHRVDVVGPFFRLAAVSGDAGRFSVTLRVPRDASPGDYPVEYAVSKLGVAKAQTMRVIVTGSFHLQGPPVAAVGQPATMLVRFVPSDGGALDMAVPFDGHASSHAGIQPFEHEAPPFGRDAHVLIPSPGDNAETVTITLASASPAIVADVATVDIRFGRLVVDWALPAFAVRGEDVTLSGRLSLDGRPVAAPPPATVTFFGPHRAPTDADGRFTVVVPVPADAALRGTPLSVDYPGFGSLATTTTLPVKARTTVTLDAPRSFDGNGDVTATWRVVDDQGTPLGAALVRLTATQGDVELLQRSLATAADGSGSAVTQAFDVNAGDITFAATFAGDDKYVAASATATVVPAGLFGLSSAAWSQVATGGGILLLVAAAAVAAWFAWRFTQKRAVAPTRRIATAPVVRGGLALALPDLAPDLPAVFGRGENARVTAPATADWTVGPQKVATDTKEVTLAFEELGDVEVTAAAGDDHGTLTVRVVDYRKEIAREFDDLLDVVAPLAPSLTPRATAREVEFALMPYTPSAHQARLAAVVEVLEHASYSHHPINRDHFVRFHRAARDLADAYAERAGRARLSAGRRAPQRAPSGARG